MTTISVDVPRAAISPPQQEGGAPFMSLPGTLTVTGSGTFQLQVQQETAYGGPQVVSASNNLGPLPGPYPGAWQPVGAVISAAGSYSIPGGNLRLLLVSGNANGVRASVTY